MSSDSSSGLDGISGIFYYHYWDIIAEDLYHMVLEFFNGGIIPRVISHALSFCLKSDHLMISLNLDQSV